MFQDIVSQPPTFVNELGVKWWFESSLTMYARRPNLSGIKLPEVAVYIVQNTDGAYEYVIVDHQDVLFASQQMDAIGTHIDMMKLAEQKK
jgi:hypothetical protein